MKDSVPVHDHAFPMILSYNSPEGLTFAGDMLGPEFEYHLFAAATGLDVGPAAFEQACERVFNLERAFQIRNYHRQRADDELVIPFFETEELWENPLLGQKKRLERGEFLDLLERYYRLRGWDATLGRPTGAKLRSLGLRDVAEELEGNGLIAPAVEMDQKCHPS
jgi:aldehyde:ferredoxin oxidoreductase